MRIATAIRSLVLAAAVSIIPAVSHAGVFVSIGIGAPPVLPVYVQPVCPAPGYIWTPGYWGWGDGGYLWHAGYWGPHVGFYGGVNYGFGYFGRGFEGGYWDHDRFRYNAEVMHVDHERFHEVVYNKTVINNYNTTRVSFNGGRGGVQMRPTAQEQNWGREQHTAPLVAQHQNEMRASQNRAQFANVNHGQPQNLARTEPASFNRNMPVNTRPAVNNNAYHPQANTQMNQHTQPQTYRPQSQPQTYHAQANPQMNDHTQPQAYHPQAQPQQAYHAQPQQAYHAQPQQTYHPQPQQTHQAPQPQESHGGGGGGHDGGGGHGHGR